VRYGVLLVLWVTGAGWGSLSVFSQTGIWYDTIPLFHLTDPARGARSLIRYRYTQEAEYSLTFSGFFFLNWQHEKSANNLALQQKFRYQSVLEDSQHFRIVNLFTHGLGAQFFFDSLSKFQVDENVLDTRIEFRLHPRLTINFSSNLSTRFFNGYDYLSDSTGCLIRVLNSSFLTPLFWTFSLGAGWRWPGFGVVSLGMGAAKLTCIRDQSVYDARSVDVYYGVPRDKGFLFEYGLSLQIVVDKTFRNRVRWMCDLLIFKNKDKPADLSLKNLIDIRINRYLKTSIQTRLFYEELVSRKLQVENVISLGFSLRL
jgi:hypothetical protein